MKLFLLITVVGLVAAEDPPKPDADKIQGTWVVSRMEIGGKNQPQNARFTVRVTFEGDKLRTKVGRNEPEPKGTFKLDPSRSPKLYDVTPPQGKPVPGIYELDGDTLKVCLGAPGEERPTEFKTNVGDERTLIVYKREKGLSVR